MLRATIASANSSLRGYGTKGSVMDGLPGFNVHCEQSPVDVATALLPPALHIVPALGVDETLYSWCATVHFRIGFHNARTTSELLFGRPYAALLHDFPAYVGHLATRTDNLLGDARNLALSHTLLGHFLVLVEKAEANCIIERVIEGSMPHLKMRIGITGAGLGGSHWLKFCPQCVKSDREAGINIWPEERDFLARSTRRKTRRNKRCQSRPNGNRCSDQRRRWRALSPLPRAVSPAPTMDI